MNHLVDNQKTKIELVSIDRIHRVDSWVRRHKGKDSPKNQPPWTQECTHTQYNQHPHTQTCNKQNCITLQQTGKAQKKAHQIKANKTKKTSWSKHEKKPPLKSQPFVQIRRFETNDWTIGIFISDGSHEAQHNSAWVRFFSCFKKTSKNLAKNGMLLGCLGWLGLLGCSCVPWCFWPVGLFPAVVFSCGLVFCSRRKRWFPWKEGLPSF